MGVCAGDSRNAFETMVKYALRQEIAQSKKHSTPLERNKHATWQRTVKMFKNKIILHWQNSNQNLSQQYLEPEERHFIIKMSERLSISIEQQLKQT